MAQTVDQAYGALAGVYDPQTNLLNQQISQADVDAATQQASLDQAKVNAFKDIDLSANRKGILFSGFSPNEQAGYLGTKYLPAVANLKSTTLNTKNTLMSRIQTLNAQRRQQAEGTVAAQQKAEAEQAYRDQQLALSYARLQVSASRSRGDGYGRGGGGGAQVNPAQDFLNYISSQFKASGKNPARQQQDAWANAWFAQNKVSNANRQQYWNLFNQTFNRPDDPTKDWLWRK